MAAQAELSLNPSAHACSRQRLLAALYGCATLLVVVIGVLGLLQTSWLRQTLESWINIHLLFGFLLFALVIARYQWHVRQPLRMQPPNTRELSRHLSRILYLVLYVVIGIRQSIGIINSICHGGAVDFDLFDDRYRNGPDSPGWNPRDDFQLFLASGFFALILVRVLAFRLWLRSAERSAPSSPSPAPAATANRIF